MKSFLTFLKKALTSIGILLVLAIIALVFTLLALWFGWPVLSGLVVALVVAAFLLVGISIKKLLAWRNKKAFVSRVLKQDQMTAEPLAASHTSALRSNFDFGIAALRRSPLGRLGNPLHALPWIMVLGAAQSGKSTLIGKTHRVRPVGDSLQPDDHSPLLWNFLPDAVVLEVQDAFAEPLTTDSPAATDWETLLTLLTSTRHREVLNGLVFTISLSQLLDGETQNLRSYAVNLRNRLQQLILVSGSIFPVYLVITGLDTLPGMDALLARLPAADRERALGRLNDPDMPLEGDTFAAASLAQVESDLRRYLETLALEGAPPTGDDLMALLNLRELKERLELFSESVFRSNPHQAASMFRGLYFTGLTHITRSISLMHRNAQLSMHAVTLQGNSSLTLPPQPEAMPVPAIASIPSPACAAEQPMEQFVHEEYACFVSELFTSIIPRDRALHRPMDNFQATRTRVQIYCLGAWYVMLFSLCALFALNTVYNFDVFSEQKRLEASIENKADPLNRLYSLADRIVALEHAQNIWWIPTMGLNRMLDLERHEKRLFVRDFTNSQMLPVFEQVNAYLNTQLTEYDHFVVLQRILWLSSAVNMRKTQGTSVGMRQVRFPVSTRKTGEGQKGTADTWSISFGHLFLQYADWIEDPRILQLLETRIEETAIHAVNTNKHKELAWILTGVNEYLSIEPVTLLEFSGAVNPDTTTSFVAPAYTRNGYAAMKILLTGVQESTDNNPEVQNQIKKLWKTYYHDYAAAWKDFAFTVDNAWMENTQDPTLLDMVASHDFNTFPQVRLLRRMADELQPLVAAQAVPAWARGVIVTAAVIETGLQLNRRNTEGDLSTLDVVYNTFTSPSSPLFHLYQNLNIEFSQARGVADSVGKTYLFFRELTKTSTTISSSEKAFQMAQMLYGGLAFGDASDTSIAKAQKLIPQIFATLPGERTDAEVALVLLQSIVRCYGQAMTIQAANLLEKLWESDVAAPAMLLPDGSEQLGLFGGKGVVTLFLDTRAKAFLIREKGAYQAHQWEGIHFPFTSDFLAYIQNGQASAAIPVREKYQVSVRSQPTSVNASALEKPVSTVLTMQCQDGTTVLENQNYPKRQTFEYIPKESGATRLEIRFPSVTLSRDYPTFVDFLEDFSYGERTFRTSSFPEQADVLASRGINEITVRLFPDNALDIVARQNATIPAMPDRITYTW